MNVYQQDPGPSNGIDFIRPYVFPDFDVSSLDTIDILHTETQIEKKCGVNQRDDSNVD